MRKCSVVVLVVGVALSMGTSAQNPDRSPSTDASSTAYASIGDLQQQMASGKLESQQLVRDSVQRIETLDQAGPRVNAVLQLNPEASKIAAERDRQRRAGDHSALWGIPILLKANIDTGDRMPT
ncbi:MAG: amidase family protein, partial [Rhodanobacteraceae bacterium]